MAALLSSSPPHVPDSDIISTPPGLYDSRTPWLVSGSPDPPSPSKLLKRKPQGLKSGSRAAEIPPGAALGFASAGVLVRERHLTLEEDKDAEGQQALHGEAAKPKKTTKRPTKQTQTGDDANVLPKNPRKRKTKVHTDAGPLVLAQPAGDGASTKKTVKQRVQAGTRETTDSTDSAVVAQGRQGVAENPKKRRTKAPLNNSDLINEIIGPKTLKPAAVNKVGEAGAVEKANTDGLASATNIVDADEVAPSIGKAVPDKPRARKLNSQKTTEKKPRGGRSKSRDIELAEARDEMNTIEIPKPKARRPSARNTVETTSRHFSRGNSEAAVPQKSAEIPEEAVQSQPAMIRRRSWTPPKDTNISPNGRDPSRPIDVSESPVGAVSPTLKTSFSSLLDTFGYSKEGFGQGNVLPARTESGEAFTKRRKLEVSTLRTSVVGQDTDWFQLVDKLNHSAGPNVAEPCPEKPEKAPKKRPRTITDLATAAYRPALTNEPVESLPVDPKVSAFFAPRTAPLAEAEVPEVAGAEKPKRAARQKSPTKKADGKTKKSNAKSKKATKPAAEKLLSPETALLRVNRQDVLFGTSSQLAREDSPTFIRNLQQAIRDSDVMGTQNGNIETLHLKPAVVGSGLSLVGRRRGLWAAAARDSEDGILEEEKGSGVDEELSVFEEDSTDSMLCPAEEAPSRMKNQTATAFSVATIPSDAPTPAAEGTIAADMGQLPDDLAQTRATPIENDIESFPSAQPVSPSSDYIDIDEFDHQYRLSQQQNCAGPSNSTPNLYSSPDLPRRTVLQPLAVHRNIPILSMPSLDPTGIRIKSTLANKSKSQSKDTVTKPAKSPTKRSRSRPPAAPKPEEGSLAAKRPRGQSRKTSVSDPDDSQHDRPLQEAVPDKGYVPLKRRPGRPRKDACPSPSLGPPEPARRRPRKDTIAEQDDVPTVSPRAKASSTTPRKRKPTHNEEWPHVDDIEDSEKDISPSPPRQKNVPDASPPLTLSLSQPDTASRKRSKVTPHAPLESLDTVFCCITTAVKAAPPSTDSMCPSWYEKMLLYDPIIVEDFAEWLNAEGIKVNVVVPVPKASKKRTRKEKDAVATDAPDDEEDVRTEVQKLPAWVVQRWCEENSICCIYKEPLRNGRRTRC